MDDATSRRIDALHAARLGCDASWLRVRGVHVVPAGSARLLVVSRLDALVVSGPRHEAEAVAALASVPPRLPEASAVRARLGPTAERIVGPVFLGYRATAPELPAGEGVARPLVTADAAAIARLRDAARPDEWEHAGFTIRRPVAGVFLGEVLAAAAGFEVLGEDVAHLGVLAHPAFRRKGAGSRAVAAAAVLAREAGYLLQYQTLESNGPSLGIAARLGFEPWGRSLSVRLATDGPASAG